MNILYVFADSRDEWNCSEWRCAIPSNAIEKLPEHSSKMMHISKWIEAGQEELSACQWADVHFIQRLVLGQTIARMEQWKAEGKIIVGDIDDSYHFMPPTARAYPFWIDGEITVKDETGQVRKGKMMIPGIEQLEWGLKLVNAITSPSQLLLDDWEKYNPVRRLIPNYIDTERYIVHKRPSHVSSGAIHIGWGGSFSHKDSWNKSYLPEALRKISLDNPNVTVHVAGDPDLVDILNLREKAVFHNWRHPAEWPRVLSQFDIGLIPLSGRYDKRRSWIKALEYTVMGIPWIGTKGPPTDPLAKYGTVITNSLGNWVKGIQDIIDHYDDHKAKVESGFEFAMAQDISFNAQKMIDVYQEIADLYK